MKYEWGLRELTRIYTYIGESVVGGLTSSPVEDGTDTGSETSAFNNNETPGKYPEELLSV